MHFFDKIAIFDRFGMGFGMVWGGIWEGCGRDLGRFGRILKGLGALWVRSIAFFVTDGGNLIYVTSNDLTRNVWSHFW